MRDDFYKYTLTSEYINLKDGYNFPNENAWEFRSLEALMEELREKQLYYGFHNTSDKDITLMTFGELDLKPKVVMIKTYERDGETIAMSIFRANKIWSPK